MRRTLFCAAMVFALGDSALAGVPAGPPASAPASAAGVPASAPAELRPADARWRSMMEQLGAADFALREAAQKQLDQTNWRDLALVQAAAEAAGDPEIKARLTARVEALREEIAVNPPPISVELKNASLMEVADALAKALGVKIEPYPTNRPELTWTLSAVDKPFWEVFLALSKQHSLTLQDNGSSLRLNTQTTGYRNGIILGPVAIFPNSISRQRSANLQAEPASQLGQETMSLSCIIAYDPRVRLVKYASPAYTEILDDLGNTLYKANPSPSLSDLSRPIVVQSFSTSMQLPEKRGTRIASVKGVIHYVAQSGEEHVDIADLDKKTGQSFDIGGNSVKLTRFVYQGNPDSADINLGLELTRNAQPAGAAAGSSLIYPTAILLDDTGRTVYTNVLRGSMGAGIGGGGYVAPFKLRLQVATKTKDVQVPFELKDLPLP